MFSLGGLSQLALDYARVPCVARFQSVKRGGLVLLPASHNYRRPHEGLLTAE